MTGCVERVASLREPQHLLLTRPCDRCFEETGDTDSARQPTIDSSFDEAWREEGQRYRHADVALAAGLPCGGGQRPQMVVVVTSSERTPFARMSGGPLPLALGCPATRQGSPWVRFPEGTLHDLPIRYPQRYPGRGFAP
jgi:hypothetical protein